MRVTAVEARYNQIMSDAERKLRKKFISSEEEFWASDCSWTHCCPHQHGADDEEDCAWSSSYYSE